VESTNTLVARETILVLLIQTSQRSSLLLFADSDRLKFSVAFAPIMTHVISRACPDKKDGKGEWAYGSILWVFVSKGCNSI
jgi:hypothetical protein